tara:strand:- start:3331 stop:3444 length:114 start_codon:yes stop_codon:yes gene_type:complete
MFDILRNTEDRPEMFYLPDGKFFFVMAKTIGGRDDLS